MASGIAAAAAAGGAFTVPYVGWAVGLAAAYIDTTIIYPKLAGSPDEARLPQLASLPSSEQGPGAPRTFAIGARMRVPAHVMYQSSKAREVGSGSGTKGGTGVTLRRVFVNALLHLNDRPTTELLQLIGNGQLLLFNDRNLIGVTSENLTATVTGGYVSINLVDEFDPDFRDTFKVGDLLIPRDFVRNSGPTTWNGTYYEVTGVIGATPTQGSSMSVIPIDGQSISGLSYGGGTPFSPASVRRVDDAIGGAQLTFERGYNLGVGLPGALHLITNPGRVDPGNIFAPGDIVTVRNMDIVAAGGSSNVNVTFTVRNTSGNTMVLESDSTNTALLSGIPNQTSVAAVSGKELIIDFAAQQNFSTGVFPPDFDSATYYNKGGEQQSQPTVLLQDFGSGNTSNYRGMASQGLQDCYVSAFGDQLPTNLEAILDIDEGMSWPQALEAIMQRGDLLNTEIDARDVEQKPFRGAFVRGVVPVAQQLQPLLVAGQILTQDRDGTVSLFDTDNADSVQLENGSAFTDLGTRIGGQQSAIDKVQMEDKPEADMPTSIGVRFQDPDAAFSQGYEHFGLRNPDGVDHVNEQVVDLSSMALTRREARNLTTTMMRRAWVNRRTYRFTLPAAYIHLLENDLVTWTDDEGEDIVARIIQRDIGANYMVNVTAVSEMTQLAVAGSPVQSSSAIVPQSVSVTASLLTVPIDAPGVTNAQVNTPSVLLAVADQGNSLQSATVWESKDGNSYTPQGSVSSSAAVAGLAGTLSSQDPSETYGTTTVTLRSQTVDVFWVNQGTDTVEACTQAQAEAGKNWVALVKDGDPSDVEIAAFTTVSANADGSYTLGGWLRGLRGTSSGARNQTYLLVMLTQSTGGLFSQQFGGPTPSSLDYRVVPAGGDLTTTTNTSFSSPTFRNVLPLPVREVTKSYNATAQTTRFLVEDASVPTHWQRAVLPLGTQPPHTLDEPFEAYRIKFYSSVGFDVLVDEVVIDSRNTGTPTLRDRYFDWPDARATFAGYTPGGSPTYNIGVVHIGQHGEGPEAQFTV
jgi:hypothetical protein